ncbi:heavy metal translocating P-type ATPase [bacterium]|nr:heavy metal translocating P-type ATPase [bacterium]
MTHCACLDHPAGAAKSQPLRPQHHAEDDWRWLLAQPLVCLIGSLFGAVAETWWPGVAAGLTPAAALVPLMAYVIAYIAGGAHAVSHAWGDLRRGEVSIDLLMVLAAIGSAVIGHWADGGALLFLFSLSHALEALILGRTRRAISDLMDLTPEEAVRLIDGREERVAVTELHPGDVVLVHPGERLPIDGVIRSGSTSIDESPVNGESLPKDKTVGDNVFAGTLNQEGVLEVEVTRAASQSTLARMVQLVEEAQSERAQSQQFTEWFGARYTWVVLGLAAITYGLSISISGLSSADAFYRAMTVLVVASPCAVVISIPAAILTAISSAARGGVLFKGGLAVERAATLQAMAFDKTGTLTIGRPRVVEILTAEGITQEQVVQTAASLESHSEHPLAKAMMSAAHERQLELLPFENVQAVTGHGITGDSQGQSFLIGKISWFQDQQYSFEPQLKSAIDQAMTRGSTVVALAAGKHLWGALALADTLRPTAAAALQELRALGLQELVMLTGDAAPVAQEIGRQLQLEAHAALLPADKLNLIREIRSRTGTVGMIGDGMNDAPSLAAADLGFSLGGAGTDVALETADVVILADDLRRLPYAIALSRRAQAIIRQNLTFAFGMMLSLLVTTLFITIPLPLAVLGHEGSTVLVILNGLRLLRFPKPRPLAK